MKKNRIGLLCHAEIPQRANRILAVPSDYIFHQKANLPAAFEATNWL